jgi:single-strand DNA-binding protein
MNIKGIIKSIEKEQKISEKFCKREFVIEVDYESNYPQLIQMELVNDKCDLIDPYLVGEKVTVHFNLRGREVSTKDGKKKVYNTIQAWKFEKE